MIRSLFRTIVKNFRTKNVFCWIELGAWNTVCDRVIRMNVLFVRKFDWRPSLGQGSSHKKSLGILPDLAVVFGNYQRDSDIVNRKALMSKGRRHMLIQKLSDKLNY